MYVRNPQCECKDYPDIDSIPFIERKSYQKFWRVGYIYTNGASRECECHRKYRLTSRYDVIAKDKDLPSISELKEKKYIGDGKSYSRLKTLPDTLKENPSFKNIVVFMTGPAGNQKTTSAAKLDNDWVDFDTSATLAVTAGTSLTGGTNSAVTGTQHQAFLDALESKSFNALGCLSTTDAIKGLYVNYCKRLRDELGKKFQVAVYNKAADYEGVVNVKNAVTDTGAVGSELIYWVTGVLAGTAVNASALNKKYDGEYAVNVGYTQSQLEAAIRAGEFTLHQVGDDVRVLSDINSLVTTSDTKGDVFKDNQTIRVIDQIANDIAVLFNTKYLGVVPNDNAGRISLWADIVQHHANLQKIRAIENFEDSDVTVSQGETKKAVVVADAVTVVNAMEKLYMTVTIQ